jgi:bifunctional N-acetylglucosamine-1-phosphate-uridyltransferase/glucosamine-1-phosphate-acetyltransferase GlmU-like protein
MSLAIIAAAGNGSRMLSDIPKPLTLLPNGNTFLDHLTKKLKKVVDHVVVVTNLQVLNHPNFIRDDSLSYRVQPQATGMGDAVFCASDLILQHDEILVVWCDQVGITNELIETALNVHRSIKSNSHMTVPMISKESEYIHISLLDNQISQIFQAREGDQVPNPSLNDVGLFVFSSGPNLIERWVDGGRKFSKGRLTGEYNFLPFLTYLGLSNWSLRRVEANQQDGIGVNTQDDFIKATAIVLE